MWTDGQLCLEPTAPRGERAGGDGSRSPHGRSLSPAQPESGQKTVWEERETEARKGGTQVGRVDVRKT